MYKRNSFAMGRNRLMFATGDWRRKVAHREEIPVPEQDWDDYHEALRLQARLIELGYDYEFDDEGEPVIPEPRPRTIIHYAETEEEHEARVQAKLDAGEEPDNFLADSMTLLGGAAALAFNASTIARAFDSGAGGVRSLGRARDYREYDSPTADIIAEHIRDQVRLDAFDID